MTDTTVTNVTPFRAHLQGLYAMNAGQLRRNLDSLTAEQAMAQPGEGNSIAWIVGHIVYWRQAIIETLGGDRVWAEGEAEGFKGTSRATIASVDKPWADIVRTYDESHTRLIARLEDAAASEGDDLDPASPAATMLGKLACHEAYHVGQVGLARRVLGLPGMV